MADQTATAKSVDALIEQYTGGKPSTKDAAILPGVDTLTSPEFLHIIQAMSKSTSIKIQGQVFDGAKMYDEKEIYALAGRVGGEINEQVAGITGALKNILADAKKHPDGKADGKHTRAFEEAIEYYVAGGKLRPQEDMRLVRPDEGHREPDPMAAALKGCGPITLGTGVQNVATHADVHTGCSTGGQNSGQAVGR